MFNFSFFFLLIKVEFQRISLYTVYNSLSFIVHQQHVSFPFMFHVKMKQCCIHIKTEQKEGLSPPFLDAFILHKRDFFLPSNTRRQQAEQQSLSHQ